jgi:hypothetical protein
LKQKRRRDQRRDAGALHARRRHVSISSQIARAVVIVVLATAANAQSMSSAIVGRATSKGKPLAAVAVTIDSDALQSTRAARTSARGTYWAGVLPPGSYRITFAHAGTQTVTRQAELHAAETIRVDADLEPSEEGETVTITTMSRSVIQQPGVVTTLEPSVIEPLPIRRELSERIELTPGVAAGAIRGSTDNLWIVDGIRRTDRRGDIEVEDAIEDAAVFTTPPSAEYGRFSGGVIVAVSRAGGNELVGSVRASGGESVRSRIEATIGGRVIRDALWFFLAGETREDSLFGKATGTVGRHTLIGSALRSNETNEEFAAAEYTGALTRQLIVTARSDDAALAVHRFVPARLADHVFSAGGESHAVFINDEFRAARWLLHAGFRHEDDFGTSPRLGAVYDVHGDGRRRVGATFSRYATDREVTRETALMYAQQFMKNGYARALFVRRDNGYQAFEADARAEYLFFVFGGNATLGHGARAAALWISGTPPALEQHITISILEQYRDAHVASNFAVLYRFTRFSAEPFAKLEVVDAFGGARAIRGAVGARF